MTQREVSINTREATKKVETEKKIKTSVQMPRTIGVVLRPVNPILQLKNNQTFNFNKLVVNE